MDRGKGEFDKLAKNESLTLSQDSTFVSYRSHTTGTFLVLVIKVGQLVSRRVK